MLSRCDDPSAGTTARPVGRPSHSCDSPSPPEDRCADIHVARSWPNRDAVLYQCRASSSAPLASASSASRTAEAAAPSESSASLQHSKHSNSSRVASADLSALRQNLANSRWNRADHSGLRGRISRFSLEALMKCAIASSNRPRRAHASPSIIMEAARSLRPLALDMASRARMNASRQCPLSQSMRQSRCRASTA